MENVSVSLIVSGKFKNVVMPKELLSALAVKLREDGEYPVHFAEETVIAEGIVILAKGSKNKLMVFSEGDEDK